MRARPDAATHRALAPDPALARRLSVPRVIGPKRSPEWRHALIEADGRDAADDPEVAVGFHAQLQDAVALYRHDHDGQAPDDDLLDRMAGKLAERAKAGGATEGGLQTSAYVHPMPDPFADSSDRSLFVQAAGPGGRSPLSADEVERRVLKRLAKGSKEPLPPL